MKKSLLAVVMLFAFAAASFATDFVRIDLNFYCLGNLKCLSGSKPGVQIVKRRISPKNPNVCYYSITVNLDKAQEVELEYEVVDTGDKASANIVPSLQPIRIEGGKRSENIPVECLEFEADSQLSELAPLKFSKWTKMFKKPLVVSKGDKFTIKAKFKKVEE